MYIYIHTYKSARHEFPHGMNMSFLSFPGHSGPFSWAFLPPGQE